jgi:hypothetical protein
MFEVVLGMVRRLVSVSLVVLLPAVIHAQAPREARVHVTVVDPTGGVIPTATVTLVGLDPATRDAAPAPLQTNEKGIATFERVIPGRYSIQARFEGFDLGLLRDLRINAGDSRRVVMLPFNRVEESVTVGGRQEGASSRGNVAAFGLSLTPEQIEALSDDPSELERQTSELGGSDVIIRVDSFEGQQLPPKAQIKSIHVTRDQFAAETEQPGSTFVDVITQPGVGAIRGGANFSFRDGTMDGRNQFLASGTRTPGQFRNYGFNISGALIPDRADFSVGVNGNNQYRNPILNENTITGAPSQVLNLRDESTFHNINAFFNYALTRDQTLKLGYTQQINTYTTGVGGWDATDRLYTGEYNTYGFRVMEAGPIGRRMFLNSRLSLNWVDQTTESAVERPTIVVLDSMTFGGAQQAGGTHSRNFILESDVDYVRGIHSWRAGIKMTGGSFRTDQRFNYLGTFTFSNPEEYLAGRPTLFTIETGDPSFSYFNVQGAVYLQDDIRFGKSLTLSPGVRYSAQKRVHDPTAFEPRFGITWAPFRSGRTTVRASAGTFHGWLTTDILAQAIRLDGLHQRQVIINDPSYPDPRLDEGVAIPPTKYLIGKYQLVQNIRYSAGVEQAFSPRVRVSVLYTYWHMKQNPRGENLNPLIDGVRPDPNFGNVVATVTDGEIRRHDVFVNYNLNLAPPGPATNAAWFNWRRLAVNGGYGWLHPLRNTALGPFDVPASGTLDTEWGPGPASLRYAFFSSVTSTQIRNLSINLGLNILDGFVYHETTGRDDNGDGFLNDRLPGVGLWSLRTDGREMLNMRVQYNFALGGPVVGAQQRYRANVFVNINNPTNHANYVGYSGVITSPNYRKPTAVMNPRTINMGMGVNF